MARLLWKYRPGDKLKACKHIWADNGSKCGWSDEWEKLSEEAKEKLAERYIEKKVKTNAGFRQ